MLSAPTVYLIFGTLRNPDDRLWLYRRIVRYGSPVTDELLDQVADALTLTWCGVPRWFAARLWEEALGQWAAFEGTLTGRGVDVSALPAARATRLVWATLSEQHSHDKDKGALWRTRIELEPVPAGVARRRARAAELATEGESFMSMFAAVGGRAR